MIDFFGYIAPAMLTEADLSHALVASLAAAGVEHDAVFYDHDNPQQLTRHIVGVRLGQDNRLEVR